MQNVYNLDIKLYLFSIFNKVGLYDLSQVIPVDDIGVLLNKSSKEKQDILGKIEEYIQSLRGSKLNKAEISKLKVIEEYHQEELLKIEKSDIQTKSEIKDKVKLKEKKKEIDLSVLEEEADANLEKQTEKRLIKYILEKNKATVDKLKNENKIAVDGGEVEVGLTPEQQKAIPYLTKEKIEVIDIKDQVLQSGEKFKIISLKLNGLDYTAVQIPKSIRNKKLEELVLGERLKEHESNDWFPNIDLNKQIDKEFVIRSTDQLKDQKGDILADIQLQNTGESIDILRECTKLGMKPVSIVDSLILGEIVGKGMGDEYIDFEGQKADNNETDYKRVRVKIKKIEEYIGIKFSNFNGEKKDKYIIRDYGIYKDKSGELKGYLRGGAYSVYSIDGGVFSLSLSWFVVYSSSLYACRVLV